MTILPSYTAAVRSFVPAGSNNTMRFFHTRQTTPPPESAWYGTAVTPYLSLRARLSQIWLNRWTVLTLLVLARTLIAVSSVNSDIDSARREALSACGGVESAGSALASMPHFMARGVNELTAGGIEKTVNALMKTATLAITAVEEIAIFVIHMMTSTYLCLITFAVTGSAKAVLDALDAAQKGLDSLTQKLGDEMADIIKVFNDAYDKVRAAVSGKILGISTGINLPSLNVNDDITKMRDLKLPPGFGDEIQKLKDKLPNFDQVQNATDNLIRFPFEEVKKLVNASLGAFHLNRSVFPVPAKEQLSFCNDDGGINGFFDTLLDIANKARTVFVVVLVVAAVAACVPMGVREIWRFRHMKERSQVVTAGDRDPLDAVYMVSRPYSSSAGMKLARVVKTVRRQALVRWIVAYATTETAQFVSSLAVAGLFSCLCHFILLKQLEREVPGLTAQVAGFADKVVVKINNASEQWALGTNAVIIDTNNTLNNDMFTWVNTSTTAVNNTLNEFVDQTTKVLHDAFGGTPLEEPILEVLNCLVLLKIQGIQKGLTFVHDNAHVNFPLLPKDVFSLASLQDKVSDKPTEDQFFSNPDQVVTDKITGAVSRFLNKIYDNIRTETFISLGVLAAYVILVLLGLLRVMIQWFGRDKTRGEGGTAAADITMIQANPTADYRSGNQGQYQYANDNTADERGMEPSLPAYEKHFSTYNSVGPEDYLNEKGESSGKGRGREYDNSNWNGNNRI